MMVSTRDVLNLLRAKPGRFIENVAGEELPRREGDDSLVFISVNDRDYHVTVRPEQIEDLQTQEHVVAQSGGWVSAT
jgi:hypothetical protein